MVVGNNFVGTVGDAPPGYELTARCGVCGRIGTVDLKIGTLPGAEVVWEPGINQGLVRFLDGRDDATEEDHDRRTDDVIGEIVATGEAFFGGTTWRGKRCMRVSVCNWKTDSSDVERAVEGARQALEAL